MMKQRQPAALLCAALLALLLPGCGSRGGGASSGPNPPAQSGGSAEPSAFRITQESSVRREKFRKQKEFAGFLAAADPCFLIPGLNQALTPQGITFSEETGLVYISAYAAAESPSVISAVDLSTGKMAAEYFLYQKDGSPFPGHVGGIAAAEGNLYLSARLDSDDSYSIALIPMDSLPAGGSHDVTIEETVPVPVSPSFLNYSREMLWVGNFYHPGGGYSLSRGMPFTTPTADGDAGCYILGYTLDQGALTIPDGEQYPVPDVVLVAPNKIQGMAALPDGQEGAIWLSRSYGRNANSTLLACRYSAREDPDCQVRVSGRDIPAYVLDSSRQTKAITAMPMTEGLCLGRDGSVLVLFESGSSRYSDGKYRTDHVWKMQG